MVPLLMGISKDSILRLDFDTKLPKETFHLKDVTKHAASDQILKVQFERNSFTVKTTEGKKISNLIEGYLERMQEEMIKDNEKRLKASVLKKDKVERKFVETSPILESLKNNIYPKLDKALHILSTPPTMDQNNDNK